MTFEGAKKIIDAKRECLERRTSGTDTECNNHNCENCELEYAQGNMSEYKAALRMASTAIQFQITMTK